jgi:hypothetical protein
MMAAIMSGYPCMASGLNRPHVGANSFAIDVVCSMAQAGIHS